MLQHGPEAAEVVGFHVLDEEDAMRVAYIDDGRRMQHRIVDGTQLQLDAARIAE